MKSGRIFLTAIAAGCLGATAFGAGAAAQGNTAATPAATSTAATSICGTSAGPPPATYDHVIWIVYEDKNYDTVIGSKYAPYINSTLIPTCGLATNFHPESHDSLSDYVAMSSGGLTRYTPPSIFGQLQKHGFQWRVYMESMPTACHRAIVGDYTTVHNPPLWFNDAQARCPAWDVPFSHFATDLARNALTKFTVIAPDNGHNMHNNPVHSALSNGDAWLKSNLTRIVNSPTYRAGRTAIFLTWDEGNGPKSATRNYRGENCLDPGKAHSDVSCHIATIVIAPTVRHGIRSGTFFSHYSVLRTTENMLGLGYLGRAATATGLRGAFGI